MPLPALFAIDLLAITILTFALYFPRHRNRKMLVSYLVINVGVLGITQALSSADVVSAGFGLGLFAVLSIIRLRSAEMDQSEVAYYFAALALGLLGGFSVEPDWLGPALIAAVLVAIYVGDHPRLFDRCRTHVVTLDHAYTDEHQLKARLEELLSATVHRFEVRRIDLVQDTTTVEVTCTLIERVDHRGEAVLVPLGQ